MISSRKLIILAILAFFLLPLRAQMMSSENYRIISDSVNIGGGRAVSSSYYGEDTLGEIAGHSSSITYKLKAGYQQMNESYIAVSLPESLEMLPPIMAITGGTANASAAIVVKTDSPSGYRLDLSASSTPAMAQNGSSFADYAATADPIPDYQWTLGIDSARFGFTVAGGDAATAYKNSGSLCNQSEGSADGLHCWLGFAGSAGKVVANSYFSNHPLGTETTIYYRAQSKSGGFQAPGSYQTIITATAIVN